MQTSNASPTFRRFRWPALVFAVVASMTVPGAHATEQAPEGQGILLRVFLSVDPLDPPPEYDNCGVVGSLVAYTGENLRWCYQITNHTDVPLTRHTLQSSEFGTILLDFPYNLVPGASAYLTKTEPADVSREETATWHAYTPDPPADYSDAAIGSVTVRSGIELLVTASIDPLAPPPGYDLCGTQTTIVAIPSRTVRWCYAIRNVSSIPRTRHSLVTSENGSVLDNFPYDLEPGAAAFITVTQVMDASAIDESATWTAFRPGPEHLSTSTAMARVLAVGDAIFISGFEQAAEALVGNAISSTEDRRHSVFDGPSPLPSPRRGEGERGMRYPAPGPM